MQLTPRSGRAARRWPSGSPSPSSTLALVTAYIHLILGGTALHAQRHRLCARSPRRWWPPRVPHPFVRRFAWLPRVGLAGYTAVTIAAYLVMGPYFSLGWIAKAVELGILVLLAADVVRVYGSPAGLVRARTGLPAIGLPTREPKRTA